MGAGDGAGEGDAQLRAQLEELTRQVQQRMELRRSNDAAAIDQLRAGIASGAVKLKSDIKKSSAFVKKLKLLTDQNADALIKDVQEINLTRYVSECVAALVEAPLKMVDLPAAVRVASLLHQRYAEFGALLLQTLVAAFDASYGAQDKSKLVKRRILLRLLSDLYLAGVLTDVGVVATIIQRVARRESGSKSSSSSGGSRARGNMSLAANTSTANTSNNAQLEVPLLVSFAKSAGVEFLGVLPKKHKQLHAAFPQPFEELVLVPQHALVPLDVQQQCLACFEDAYELVCKIYLAQHASLVKLTTRNEREEINRGEIADQHVQELEQAKQLFEKLQTSVNALADAMDKDVPPLPEQRRDDELLGIGISLWEGGDGGGRSEMHADSPFDDEDTRSFYEDLPDLIDLVPAVVLGLSESDLAELKKKKETARSGQETGEEEEEEEDEEEDESALVADASPEVAGEKDATAETEGEGEEEGEGEKPANDGEAETPEEETKTVAPTTTAAPTTGYHHQHDAFFASLEDLVNRDRCDKAAIEFCYRNSKANRNRLVKTLFAVPRTHLELLSYYARLVATLQSVLVKDDIGKELVELLVSEFNYHIRKRNQFRLETKIKNIRFLAELVKFRVCHPSVAFRCLKKCFSDFQGHNVYTATALLENCGRFLYCSKHTHARTAHHLAIMMKLKSAKHLDPQAETLVENAFYLCKPPERVERAAKQYDPKYLFVLKLLYEELNGHNAGKIVKTLRKLPWLSERDATDAMVVKAVLKVTKGRVMHMKWICDVVRGLARYQERVAILLVDDVLEAIRRGLELNDYRDHQVSLGLVKLLGELFIVGLASASVVLDVLYLIINQSHDLLSLPQYGGGREPATTSTTPMQVEEFKRRCKLVPDLQFDPRVPSDVDSSSDVFRIRLACALIEACQNGASASSAATTTATGTGTSGRGAKAASAASGSTNTHTGLSKPRLGRFMRFFQRYVFSKTAIPLETDFVVLDLFDALTISLKDHFQRFETWEEADESVAALLREELELAERRAAKIKAASAMASAAAAAAVPSIAEEGEFGEDDDEEESEDDEEDDDDEEEEEEEEEGSVKRGEEQEEGDEDDDDEEEDDDDDDDDEEDDDDDDDNDDEQLVIHDRVHVTEEDEDFEKAFKAMMQASAEPRKIVGRVNVDKMAIPTMIKAVSMAPSPSAFTTATDGADSENVADTGVREGGGGGAPSASGPFGGGVVFRMLRRGNKGKVEARHLLVPDGSSLAQHSQRQENAGKKEQSELKRLVLQNIEREDFFTSPSVGLELSPSLVPSAVAPPVASMAAWPPLQPQSQQPQPNQQRAATIMAPVSRATSQYQQQQQQQRQQQLKQEREAAKAGYGANAEWNNDEFGLRRGRTYRGNK